MKFSNLLSNIIFSLATCASALSSLAASGNAQNTPKGAEKESTMTQTTATQPKNDATQTTEAIRPFRVNIPDEKLVDLRRRIAGTQWPERELVADASQGVQLATMKKLADYWVKNYDWRKTICPTLTEKGNESMFSAGSSFGSQTR